MGEDGAFDAALMEAFVRETQYRCPGKKKGKGQKNLTKDLKKLGLFVCLTLFVGLFDFFVCLFVCLIVCLFVCLFVCLIFVCLFVGLVSCCPLNIPK